MAEENDGQEGDVEAEMLRMMQEELGGDEAGDGDAAPAEGGGDAGGADVDSMLEEEMLKAMEQEGGDGGSDPMTALSAFAGSPAPGMDFGSADAEGIDRLTDVEVEVTVELGDNLIPIQEIMTWASGSVVELTPEEHETVRVLLNGSPFAMGEIVVVGDTFGVRIVNLLDPADGTHH
jgi:flagellar motor switch protein FliN